MTGRGRPLRRRRRLGGSAVALAVAVLAASCGGGGHTSSTTSSSGETTSSSSSSTTPPTVGVSTIGGITQDPIRRAFVNGTEVASVGKLRAGDKLTTNSSGELAFALDRKIKECTALSGSKLQLQPSADVLVAWTAGTSVCVTTSQPGTVLLMAGGRLALTLADPVFTVSTASNRTVVKVTSGFVEVEDRSHPGTKLLCGPDQEAIAPAGGDLQGPAPIEAAVGRERVALADAQRLFTPSGLARPSPAGSPLVTGVLRQGVVRIGVVTDSRDSETAAFIETFRAALGKAWGIKTTARALSAGDERTAIRNGTTDLVITTADPATLGTGLATAPFATTSDGTHLSQVVSGSDPGLALAFNRFLGASAATGAYKSWYEHAYGGDPDYNDLRPLLVAGGVAP